MSTGLLATPSIRPTKAGEVPRPTTRNTGKRLWTISEETSMNIETRPKAYRAGHTSDAFKHMDAAPSPVAKSSGVISTGRRAERKRKNRWRASAPRNRCWQTMPWETPRTPTFELIWRNAPCFAPAILAAVNLGQVADTEAAALRRTGAATGWRSHAHPRRAVDFHTL